MFLATAFLGLGFFAYASTIGNFFLSDDFVFLARGWHQGWQTLLTDPPNRFFRPSFALLLALDQGVFGLRSSGMHVLAILLNAVNAVAVVAFASLFLESAGMAHTDPGDRQRTSLLAGLFFLLNPSHAEAIDWLSALPDVLATTFALASWLAWLVFRRHGQARWLVACLLSWFSSLLSKEAAIAVPTIILVLELARAPTMPRLGNPIRVLALFGLTFTVYLVLRRLALGVWIGGYGTDVHLNLDLVEALKSLAVFVFRSFSPPVPFSRRDLLVAVLLLAGVGAPLAYHFRRSWFPPPRAALATTTCLLLAAAPAANLGLAMQEPDGDRFLYMSTVFSGMLLALLLRWLCGRHRRVVYVAALLIALFYATALQAENQRWNRAAGVAEQIIADVAAIGPREELWVFGLPDRYGGAYLFRNGFEQALALHLGPPNFSRVHRREMRNYDEHGRIIGSASPNPPDKRTPDRPALYFHKGRMMPQPPAPESVSSAPPRARWNPISALDGDARPAGRKKRQSLTAADNMP